jgi:hypothetical protein
MSLHFFGSFNIDNVNTLRLVLILRISAVLCVMIYFISSKYKSKKRKLFQNSLNKYWLYNIFILFCYIKKVLTNKKKNQENFPPENTINRFSLILFHGEKIPSENPEIFLKKVRTFFQL